MGKKASLIAKVAVTIIALSLLFHFADFETLAARASDLPWQFWTAAMLLAAGQVLITSVRWWTILRSRMGPLPFFRLFEIHLIGLLANSFLLNGVGTTVVRAGLVYRLNVPLTTGAASVVADKLAAIAGVALLVLITAPFISAAAIPVLVKAVPWATAALLTVALCIAVVMSIPAGAEIKSKILRVLNEIWSDARHMARDHTMVAKALLLTIAGQAFLFLAACVIGRGIGIELPLWKMLLVLPTVSFFASIPISIGGWGVREGAMVFGLSLLGVGYETALTLSILLGLTSIAAILPAAALCVLHRNRALLVTTPDEIG